MSLSPEGYARSEFYGTVWLNDIFVAKGGRFRLFKKSSMRLTIAEIIWMVLITVATMPIIYFVSSLFTWLPVFGDFISPPIFAILFAPILGVIVGRKIAKASPYRRYSGEGLIEYLWVQADKTMPSIGRVKGRRIAKNHCETYVSGKRLVVPCIEWLGTSRAPMMPKFYPDEEGELEDVMNMEIQIIPLVKPVRWIDKARAIDSAVIPIPNQKVDVPKVADVEVTV